MAASDPPEIALSAAWQAQVFDGPLRTVDGRAIGVVHRGTWSNGFGPDFTDALILIDGRELRSGGVEIHVRTSGWTRHGHDRDARYDDVVLHVVLRHDGGETRRRDGASVPVLELGPILSGELAAPNASTVDWSRFGNGPCAAELTSRDPARVRTVLRSLGDARLAGKVARIEAQLALETPGEVLYRLLWDALGYSANREPMRSLASLLPLAAIEAALGTVPSGGRAGLARGLLFGAGGFLPLAPGDAALARLAPSQVTEAEAFWSERGAPWYGMSLPPTAWVRARVRPANHPVARLATGAAMVAGAAGGLLAAVLSPLRSGVDPAMEVRALVEQAGAPPLGVDRAAGMIANVVLPFALAFADQTGDAALADAASSRWERLPAAEANGAARRAMRQVTGAGRVAALGARGQQGLLQLDSVLCAPRRCFECPIARAVVDDGRTVGA